PMELASLCQNRVPRCVSQFRVSMLPRPMGQRYRRGFPTAIQPKQHALLAGEPRPFLRVRRRLDSWELFYARQANREKMGNPLRLSPDFPDFHNHGSGLVRKNWM